MNKITLKTLRIFFPGLVILILILILPEHRFESIKSINIEPWSLNCILAIVLGSLYYILGIRDIFIRDSLEDIHLNINDKLLEPFRNNNEIAGKIDKLKRGRRMLQIFYHFIDKNPSLKEKAKNVYLNGFFWSSIVDVIAISLFAIIIYFLLFLFSFEIDYLIITVILSCIHFLSKFLLLPKITEKHKKLGDEQIEFIHTNLENELEKKIKELALRL